ncbi:unnamed protein product [Caenorhabditis bovis]|uniref:Uncharacterized protein n=1 Tax=Caenorhabditis bovis TaxID=2654633 RepID=A0A8S1EQF9_9PELO|nr:unnamed protein product [Caenorhabditis bovis]
MQSKPTQLPEREKRKNDPDDPDHDPLPCIANPRDKSKVLSRPELQETCMIQIYWWILADRMIQKTQIKTENDIEESDQEGNFDPRFPESQEHDAIEPQSGSERPAFGSDWIASVLKQLTRGLENTLGIG